MWPILRAIILEPLESFLRMAVTGSERRTLGNYVGGAMGDPTERWGYYWASQGVGNVSKVTFYKYKCVTFL